MKPETTKKRTCKYCGKQYVYRRCLWNHLFAKHKHDPTIRYITKLEEMIFYGGPTDVSISRLRMGGVAQWL